MLNVGRMDTPFEIELRRDGDERSKPVWDAVPGILWADVRHLGADKRPDADRQAGDIKLELKTHYRTDFTLRHRFKSEGQVYSIDGITHMRRDATVITVTGRSG